MNVIVILKFRIGEEIVPVVLPLVNKETKELFQLLVDPLRLSVTLGWYTVVAAVKAITTSLHSCLVLGRVIVESLTKSFN